MERKNAWKKYSDEDKNNVFTFADEYKTFISECKTERECVKKAVELAKKAGYRDLQEIIAALIVMHFIQWIIFRHLSIIIKDTYIW